MTAAAFVRALRLATKHTKALAAPAEAVDALDADALAMAVAAVQDLRSRLSDVEAVLAKELGQKVGKGFVDYLPDGRQYEVTRGGDRTAWNHDDWKRDVRRKVTERFTKGPDGDVVVAVVNQETGETQPLATILQEALGLWAGDYSTTTPGPWRFAAVKPTETTTSSPEQNTEKKP
jgi:hypothetical protein